MLRLARTAAPGPDESSESEWAARRMTAPAATAAKSAASDAHDAMGVCGSGGADGLAATYAARRCALSYAVAARVPPAARRKKTSAPSTSWGRSDAGPPDEDLARVEAGGSRGALARMARRLSSSLLIFGSSSSSSSSASRLSTDPAANAVVRRRASGMGSTRERGPRAIPPEGFAPRFALLTRVRGRRPRGGRAGTSSRPMRVATGTDMMLSAPDELNGDRSNGEGSTGEGNNHQQSVSRALPSVTNK